MVSMKKLEPFLPFFSLILAIALYSAVLIAFVKHEFPSREHIEPPVYAAAAYSNKWNLYIANCQELYFATSDHTAFNEGCRYSVLKGPVAVPSAVKNRRGETLSKRTGSGANEMIGNMLEDVYRILEVPNDDRFLMKDCEWTMLSTERGDWLLIVRNAEENTVMLAEELR